ncbi:vWA domain-containing protein [Devosia sp.]|uniref:vWA domain-containing protein n=1 Tax=Devosia sp. TaxID=1871048 RepID=UPI002EE26DE1
MICRAIAAFLLCIALAFGTTAAVAQEAPAAGKTILVLDASGSMWGQIDGVAKIEIAREVIGGLLETLPAGLELGLTAYGHREKGNCDDIESLVAPAAGTAEAIRAAVAGLSPKGMTPLSHAVQLAAEELKYEEHKATVILVSDGIETCEVDPCAVGADLERLGVDFTAHVIGFDVAEEEARAQLQCLAENTGGRFLTAANADELSSALEQVSAAAPEPEPEPAAALPAATVAAAAEAPLGATIPVDWTGPDAKNDYIAVARPDARGSDYENYAYTREGSPAQLLMPAEPGAYEIRYIRHEGAEILARAAITVVEVEASVSGAAEAPLGATIPVDWTGPNEKGDYIAVARPDARGSDYENYAYTREGSPARLLMPSEPGDYELRYILHQDATILATAPIKVVAVQASVTAPAEAAMGATIAVDWTGPAEKNDYIAVARPDARGSDYENYVYTRDGSPAKLLMPSEPGDYELRYILHQDATILATAPIKVVAVEASVAAAAEAAMGATIPVDWTGPGEDGDYIAVAAPDARGSDYENYVYTRDGSPAQLLMPSAPGEYEIRYVLNQDAKVLATTRIEVTPVAATLAAAGRAPAGSAIEVDWTGPGYDGDYLTVAEPGSAGSDYFTYAYVREGSPLRLELPEAAGTYEIRYILDQDARILATLPVTVE